jgi:hypothetical protein
MQDLLRAPSRARRVIARLARRLGLRPLEGKWRSHLRTYEVEDASTLADELFRRSFGHGTPAEPRHFVLVYFPPVDAADPQPRVVGYSHHRALDEVYLGGGMCVDERVYRQFPRWLFEAVKAEGGLATLVARDSIGMLDDSPACFGHVGEPRARQADLRTGFLETGLPHLMVFWRREVPEAEKQRLIAKVAAHGPF